MMRATYGATAITSVAVGRMSTSGTSHGRCPGWIVLIESWDDVDVFRALCRSIVKNGVFGDADAVPEVGIYRLQNSRSKLPWSAG